MKAIKALILFLIASLTFASVNYYHAMNVFKGSYKFEDPLTGDTVEFSITNKEKITLKENDVYYDSSVSVQSLGNGIGPSGLSIMTVMLAGGSDEQTYTAFIRLYPNQDGEKTKTGILDFIIAENDGPNDVTYIHRDKIKLYKKAKNSKKYYEVKK